MIDLDGCSVPNSTGGLALRKNNTSRKMLLYEVNDFVTNPEIIGKEIVIANQ